MRFFIFWLGLTSAWAITDIYQFPTQAQHTEFENLTHELRCLVCQNQTLADSDAPLAHDLRTQVAKLVLAQKNETDVIDYLKNRYGDFVLYQPPFNLKTYLLWAFPIIMLGFCLLVVFKKM